MNAYTHTHQVGPGHFVRHSHLCVPNDAHRHSTPGEPLNLPPATDDTFLPDPKRGDK